MFRGIFGNAFRQLVCTRKDERNCSKCPVAVSCEFAKNFHNINFKPDEVEDKYKKFSNFPPKFVFFIPEEKNIFNRNEELGVYMTFCGNPKINFVLLYSALRIIEDYPVDNRTNARLQLLQIIDSSTGNYLYTDGTIKMDTMQPLYIQDVNNNVTSGVLRFLTHCRITNQSIRVSTEINESIIGRRIQERLKLLSIDSGTPYQAKWHHSELNITRKNLFWEEIRHKSNRQREKLNLGGFIGEIYIECQNLSFWRDMQKLEFLHLGSNAQSGYGKFNLTLVV